MLGLVGKKCGMTRIFMEDGSSVPVTVVAIADHYVTQIKRKERDGYTALQLATVDQKPSRVSRPVAGQFAKANAPMSKYIKEFRVEDVDAYSLGDVLDVSVFHGISLVDVTGRTKGKGFAGVVKRWGFRTQDASHGNSLSHRAPGSIGQNQTPGRVFKELERKLLLIQGAVPGSTGSCVIVKPAVKAQG